MQYSFKFSQKYVISESWITWEILNRTAGAQQSESLWDDACDDKRNRWNIYIMLITSDTRKRDRWKTKCEFRNENKLRWEWMKFRLGLLHQGQATTRKTPDLLSPRQNNLFGYIMKIPHWMKRKMTKKPTWSIRHESSELASRDDLVLIFTQSSVARFSQSWRAQLGKTTCQLNTFGLK